MIHVTSGPALVVEIGLAIFCFIDVLLAPEPAARWIPRWGWVLSVLIFPAVGCVLWLVAGRTWRTRVRDAAVALGATGTPGTPGAATAVPGDVPGGRDVLEPAGGNPTGSHGSRRSAAEIMASLTGGGQEPAPRVTDLVPDGPISPWPRDPGLAGQVWDLNEEHERTLRLWEADLRRREEALRRNSAR